jgi:hypothetical protein
MHALCMRCIFRRTIAFTKPAETCGDFLHGGLPDEQQRQARQLDYHRTDKITAIGVEPLLLTLLGDFG